MHLHWSGKVYLWEHLCQIFRTHPRGKVLIFWCTGKIITLSTPSSNHVYIFVDILLGSINNTNPWMLEPVRSSFQYLQKRIQFQAIISLMRDYEVFSNKKYKLTSTASVPLSIRSIFVSTPKVLSPDKVIAINFHETCKYFKNIPKKYSSELIEFLLSTKLIQKRIEKYLSIINFQ